MSAPSRCHNCLHKQGPRSVSNLANVKDEKGKKGTTPKKRSCTCVCHSIQNESL